MSARLTPAQKAAKALKPLTKSQIARVSTLLTLSEQQRMINISREGREAYEALRKEIA